jgi:ribokinase
VTIPRGVLCSGSINYDIVVRPVEAPQWGTTTFVENLEFLVGGNGANTSVALATLGIPTRLVGLIGADEPGRYLLGQLTQAGVDASAVAQSAEPTSATIVMINGEGNRKFLNRPGSSGIAFAEPIDFDDHLTAGMSHFHMASLFILPQLRSTAPETLRRARAAGLTTSLDTTWDPKGQWMEALEPCLEHLDFLFMNEDEARMVTGSDNPADAARQVLSRGVGAAVMKLSSRGCAIYWRRRLFRSRIPLGPDARRRLEGRRPHGQRRRRPHRRQGRRGHRTARTGGDPAVDAPGRGSPIIGAARFPVIWSYARRGEGGGDPAEQPERGHRRESGTNRQGRETSGGCGRAHRTVPGTIALRFHPEPPHGCCKWPGNGLAP